MSEKISYNSTYTEQNTTKKPDSNFNAPFSPDLQSKKDIIEESVTKNKENIWFKTKSKLDYIGIEVGNNDENIIKLNEISDIYNTSEELLKDPIARRRVLELSFNSVSICPSLKFKNEDTPINYQLFTDKIIDIEKKELKEILSLYKGKDGKDIDIENIFSWDTCQPINLLKKLEGIKDQEWNVLSEEKKKDILSSLLDIKTYDFRKTIDIILEKHWLDKNELINLSPTQVLERLEKKWVSEEKSKIIIKNLKKLNYIKEVEEIVEKTGSLKDTTKAIENLTTINEVKEYLEENSEKFLKVVNDLNIYKNNAKDISVVLNWKHALNKLSEMFNNGLLDNNPDAVELLGILQSYFHIEIENKIIKNEKLDDNEQSFQNKIKAQVNLNQITWIDNKSYSYDSYYIEKIPEKDWEKTTIYINWKNIELSSEEYEIIIEEKNWKRTIKNPEALKNLVDFKEKMKILNLWFVWKYRNELIDTMKNYPWYRRVEMDIKDDYIDKTELNNLLNFILEMIWEKWNKNDIFWTYSKIIEINQVSEINNKKDSESWLSNIWFRFKKTWFLNNDWNLNIWWKSKLLNYRPTKKELK